MRNSLPLDNNRNAHFLRVIDSIIELDIISLSVSTSAMRKHNITRTAVNRTEYHDYCPPQSKHPL